MDPLLDRIAERRGELAEQVARLRKELAEVDAELEDLPEDYQRLYRIVAEEQLVACKRATSKLGLSGEPRHTEAVRNKLKRLVARG